MKRHFDILPIAIADLPSPACVLTKATTDVHTAPDGRTKLSVRQAISDTPKEKRPTQGLRCCGNCPPLAAPPSCRGDYHEPRWYQPQI